MASLLFSFLQDQTLEHPIRSGLALLVILPFAYVIANEFVRRKARVPGFKGPAGLPLIGNIADIKYNAAEKYRQWSETYGDVYQIQLGNVPVIVVNSAASARVIFGQYSQALSSRPVFYTFHKVCPYFPSHDHRTPALTVNRSFPTQLARPLALPHSATPSSVVERVPPPLSTSPQSRRTSHISTSRPLPLSRKVSSTVLVVTRVSILCP